MFDQPSSPSSQSPVNTAPRAPLPAYQPPVIPQPPREPVKKTGKLSSVAWLILILVVLGAAGGGGYFGYQYYLSFASRPAPVTAGNEPVAAVTPEPETPVGKVFNILGAPIAFAQEFANYNEPAVAAVPAIANYQTAADLSNIENLKDFTPAHVDFSEAAKQLLAKNNFVVLPGQDEEFFSLYESNRYAQRPSLITTDSLLHNYHLAFDSILRTVEIKKFKQYLTDLTYQMVLAAKAQSEELKGTAWENAAKRNLAFFTVANKLLYPAAVPAPEVAEAVAAELKMIEEHNGIYPSAVMAVGSANAAEANLEDYSQYIPRGHYTRSEDLKVYFKSMMYLGRLTFRQKNDDETKSALLVTLALSSSQNLRDLWERIYQPTAFFVGVADDLTYSDYGQVLAANYGQSAKAADLTDEAKFKAAGVALSNLAGPKINSMPIFDARFQPDREKEIKGFRFMGQRYTLDADIFQRLIYREVGDKEHQCDTDPASWIPAASRRLPSGLDIAAAFGSNEAYQLQVKKGETGYACYNENLDKMQQHVDRLDNQTWVQNLYWGWLYNLRPLLAPKGQGYPAFMQNPAWAHKELNTFLGNWTELKHDTILYAKQVYAELGGGAPEPKDDRGYVEPNPYVYARLAALAKMTKEGLQLRNLIDDAQADLLTRLETISLTLKTISEKELNNQALSAADYDFIRAYGGSLEHMWLQANKDLGVTGRAELSQEPAALVADVATDPSGTVLEEATGRINEIYAVVPIDGKLRLVSGGVYSYYEFGWPLADRLSDEKWRAMLNESKAPARPDWTGAFLAP